MRLALRDGLENVRVTDIAAEAGVSPRTYNNYFSSIPEAICAVAAHRARGIGEALRGRPESEPLADAISAAVFQQTDPGTAVSRDVVRLIIRTPALRGEFFKAVAARENSLAEAIAERIGSPADDLFPRLLAATYCSASRVVTHRWLDDEDSDYGTLLREAFDLIAPMAAAGHRDRQQAEPRAQSEQPSGQDTPSCTKDAPPAAHLAPKRSAHRAA
jgi:AcrR family transcriptional regulator